MPPTFSYTMSNALRQVYSLCLSKGWVKDEEDYLNQWNEMQAILHRAYELRSY